MAVQELGDASRAFELAELNQMSISDDLQPGTTLIIPDPDSNKLNLIRIFSIKAFAPASADTSNDLISSDSGIDYDAIEIDLIVT